MNTTLIFLISILLLGSVHAGPAANDIRLDWVDKCTTAFSGIDFPVNIQIWSPRAENGTLGWKLTINQSILAQGKQTVSLAEKQLQHCLIDINLPTIKEGITQNTSLMASYCSNNPSSSNPTSIRKDITIFSKNPIAYKEEWLRKLDIHLFDPGGKTSDLFTQHQIPHHQVHDLDRFMNVGGGILLVGEGLSLSSYPEFTARLCALAANGTAVFILAPRDGDFVLPGDDPAAPSPVSVQFKKSVVINEFDQRFDDTQWGPVQQILSSSMSLSCKNDRLVGSFMHDDKGWPWLEIEYADPGTLLVLCGFGIIDYWEVSPTPRFLLIRVLERIGQHKSTKEKNEIP